MFDAFAITVREVAELILIVGSLAAYLRQAGRQDLAGCIGWGLAVGLVPASALAMVLIDAEFGSGVEAALAASMATGVLLMAVGMGASAGKIRGRVQLFFDAWLERPAAPAAVIAFVAIASFRESLEIAVFVRAIHAREGTADALAGVVFGVAAASLLLPAWRWLSVRSSMLALFRASALLLSLLSIELLLHGVAELLHAPLFASAGLDLAAEPFLEGGARYGWVCGVLMLAPVLLLARGWWLRSGAED